jgi:predicted secreted protein
MDMGSADDLRYWQRRERESLAAAERAQDPHLANIHRSFARNYRAAVDRLTAMDAGASR